MKRVLVDHRGTTYDGVEPHGQCEILDVEHEPHMIMAVRLTRLTGDWRTDEYEWDWARCPGHTHGALVPKIGFAQ